MENSCEEPCLIWGQRKQDEVYSTSETIEEYTVHLPAPAANVFIGWRFLFLKKKNNRAQGQPAAVPGLVSSRAACVPFLRVILEDRTRKARGSFIFCFPR